MNPESDESASPSEPVTPLPLVPHIPPVDTHRTPSIPPRTGANYVIRHWRGDLSLPRSYWVNLVALRLALGGLEYGVLSFAHQVDDPRPIVLAGAVLDLAICLVFVWQVVGVINCARKTKLRSTDHFWPNVAFVLVLLGIVATITKLPTLLPAIWSEFTMALVPDPYNRYSFDISGDGTTLYVRGTLGFSFPAEFKSQLKEHPQVHTVIFDSLGGRMHSGLLVGEILSQGSYSTQVETKCASACVFAFMGGTHRTLGPLAKMGFHHPGWPSMISEQYVQAEITHEKEFLGRRGVRSDFIEHAYATAFKDLWVPTTKELFDAGIINGVILNGKLIEAAAYANSLSGHQAIDAAQAAPYGIRK